MQKSRYAFLPGPPLIFLGSAKFCVWVTLIGYVGSHMPKFVAPCFRSLLIEEFLLGLLKQFVSS